MAFFFTKETKSFYIARPAEHANDFIYQHPDKSISRGSKITVRSDECALFFREGRYIATIPPGTTTVLDTANLPFLGHLLINKFTDANHFITEVFFVRLAETILTLPQVSLGQYLDLNSRHVVALNVEMQYTIKVQEPVKLISDIGGQAAHTQSNIVEIFNGRMLNAVRQFVGRKVAQLPILSIVSNVDIESFSKDISNYLQDEFSRSGAKVVRMFDMSISMDRDSLALVRDFGKREADLAIQVKGAQIANHDGFEKFNIIQGQRAALEGLGQGLASGSGTAFVGMGLGIGGGLTTARTGTGIGRRSRWETDGANGKSTSLISPRKFFLSTPAGEKGPLTERQLALIAIAENKDLGEMLIRRDDDPINTYFPATAEPVILNEYMIRK